MDIKTDDLPKAITKNTRFLSTAQALSTVPTQINSLIGSLVVLRLTGSPALAGLVISVTFVGRIVVPYFSGWAMDRKGRRVVLILGGVIISVSYLGLALTEISSRVATLFTFFLLYGVGNAIFSQVRIAMTDMYDASRAGKAIAYLYTSSIFGSLATIPLVALIGLLSQPAGLDPYALLWLSGSLSMLPALLAILLVRPDTSVIARVIGRSGRNETGLSVRVELSRLTAPFAASSVSWGIMVAMMSLLSLDMAGDGFPLFLISTTITIHVAGMYLPSFPFGRITDRYGPKMLMVAGPLVTGVGGLLTPLTANYYVITIGMFLVGVGWCGSTISSTSSIVSVIDASARGRVLGANDVTNNIASMILPFAGGAVIGAYGFLGLGVFALALSLPASLVSFAMSPRKLPTSGKVQHRLGRVPGQDD